MRSQIIPIASGVREWENKAFHPKQWNYSDSVLTFIKYDKALLKQRGSSVALAGAQECCGFQQLLSFSLGITWSPLNFSFRGRQTSSNCGSPEPWETRAPRRNEPAQFGVNLSGQGGGGIIMRQKLLLLQTNKQRKAQDKFHDKSVFNFIISHTLLDVIKGLHLLTVPLNEEHYLSVSG